MKHVAGLVMLAVGSFAGCSTPAARTEPASSPADSASVPTIPAPLPAVPMPLPTDPASIQAIARLEDMRTIGPSGELLQYLGNPDPVVRTRAALALGRLRFPNGGEATTAKLRAALRDSDEKVRACAAFALGMREDPSAYEELVGLGSGATKDESALVRARAIEAASKLNRHEMTEQFLGGFDDPSAEVRLETAAGTARWKTDAPRAGDVNARVAAFVAKESDVRARGYGLFALEHRKAKEGRDVCLKSARAAQPEERLFAVRGLANLVGDPAVDEALQQASFDADWRIAVEALRGLAKCSARPALDAMAAAIGNANHHVRAVGLESATEQFDAFLACGLAWTTQGVGNFDQIWFDPSLAVCCAAVRNMLRFDDQFHAGEGKWPHWNATFVRELARSGRWETLGSYLMYGTDPSKLSLLEGGAIEEALADANNEMLHGWLIQSLSGSDNGIRLAAVTALLAKDKPQVEISVLAGCYKTSNGEISPELHFNILKLAAKIGGDEAKALLERGLDDSDAFVRRTAHDELEKLTGTALPWTDRPLPEVELAIPGEGLLANNRPHVVIATARGEMEFVLFADEAPQHVVNFLKHADFYKGTTFHRIVSDFVAQGGDARGDGNGGSSWRGDALRHEITPRKYVRGSLGMPRNEDWDSGGSQIFITHRATPHLDGRYTIFGELVKGFEVLDALDLADKIVEVRVLP